MVEFEEGKVLKVFVSFFAKTASSPRFINKPYFKNTEEVRLVQARHTLGLFT